MKFILIVPAFLLLATFSCKKDKQGQTPSNNGVTNVGEDFGCIKRIWISQGNQSISAANYATIVDLFSRNGLDYSKLRFYKILRDTINATEVDVHIYAFQYVNGLTVFINNEIFHFKNGIYDFLSGGATLSTSEDTIPSLKLTQVRKVYVDAINSIETMNIYKAFKDSCLTAVFGYYNLNVGTAAQPGKLTKAWSVNTAAGFPVAYIKDDGTLISYNDGVEF